MGGQGQAEGRAAAVAGGHEDGGRLAPDLHLIAAAQTVVGLQRGLGHQQAGRATGEGQGLGVVGNGKNQRDTHRQNGVGDEMVTSARHRNVP